MQIEVTKKRFTVDEHYKMGEAGILTRDDRTEPALFKKRVDSYDSAHPRSSDALLVLEISDTSLKYDRDIKLPIYAEAGVPEVWVADLRRDSLLVHRDPSNRTYKTVLSFRRGDSNTCLAFPDIQIPVQELFA